MSEVPALKTKGVEAVDKALRIFALFSAETPTLSLGEISQRSGQVKSTAMRLLISLQTAGLVRLTEDRRYTVGAQAFRLGCVYQQTFRLDRIVRPALRELVVRTGESGSFFRREGNRRICLYREDSSQVLREHVPEGEAVELDKGAAGHVLVTFDGVDGDRPATATQLAKLPISAMGERGPDIAGISAPIFATGQGMVGALALSGPRTRFTPDRVEQMEAAVIETARSLSRELGSPFYDAAKG